MRPTTAGFLAGTGVCGFEAAFNTLSFCNNGLRLLINRFFVVQS